MIYIGALLLISIAWYLFGKSRKRNNLNKPPLTQEAAGDTKQENNFSFTPAIAEPPVLRDCEKVVFVKDGEKAQGTVRIVGAGLEVYDKYGRLIMGAEDYNKYILGTIDLPGVYFGADNYTKKILEHEQTITVDCPHFDSHCKIIPIMDIGILPYRQSNNQSLLPPERDEVYKLVGSGKLLTLDEYNKGFFERVYSYFPIAKSYKTWAFGSLYIAAVMGESTTRQGIHYWCPEPGKISYNTGGSMEANWLAYIKQDQSEYKEGDTYCGISWLLERCLILGRLE